MHGKYILSRSARIFQSLSIGDFPQSGEMSSPPRSGGKNVRERTPSRVRQYSYPVQCRKDRPMQRIAQLIGVKPEQIEAYERIHAAVWPEVLATIHACNIRNYSIFRHEHLLFAYFEYVGEDFASDMAKM